jgi:hypothetical protein
MEWRKIKKLVEQFCEQKKLQLHHDDGKMVVSCSQRSMEMSAAIIIKPFNMTFTDLQPSRMSSSW